MMDNTWGSVAEEALNHSTRIKKYSKYKDAQFSSRAALHPLMGSHKSFRNSHQKR